MERDLTTAERAELDALNKAVTDAIAKRREWLDAKMTECSDLHVGDEIFDLRTGNPLGRVSNLYRYWRDRDDGVRDDSLGCDYEYETSPHCFDNTSRQTGVLFGTKAQSAEWAAHQAQRMARRAKGLAEG